MEYLSLQYQWSPEQKVDLNIGLDNGNIVRVYNQQADLPLVAQQLSGLSSIAEESKQISFIREELKLVQPLLSLDYLGPECCPNWLIPLHQFIQAHPKINPCCTGYLEVDQLYQRYEHKSSYPILKLIMGLFSDQIEDKLKSIGFIDKLGPAANIFIKHKINEPNGRIKEKVRAANQRYSKRSIF